MIESIWLYTLGLFGIKVFGWNLVTVTILGANTLTVFQAWTTWNQNKRIWKHGSDSISTLMNMYLMCYFMAFLIYALNHSDVTMTANAMFGLIFIPVVIGIWRSKGFQKKEWLLLMAFLTMVPTMYLLSDLHKEYLFSAMIFGVLVSFLGPPIELIKTGRRGNFDIKFAFVYLITGIFWLVYGHIVDNWTFITLNPFGITIWISTILIYLLYCKK